MATRRAGAFRLTDVEPAGIQWLWPGRIPLGYVTLLVSDPRRGQEPGGPRHRCPRLQRPPLARRM
jgi:hypothetical protein